MTAFLIFFVAPLLLGFGFGLLARWLSGPVAAIIGALVCALLAIALHFAGWL